MASRAKIPGEDFPGFGEYKCTKCNKIWESSKAWKKFGQKCKHCDITVKATGLEELYHYICKPCCSRSQGEEGHWKYKLCKKGRECRACGEIVKPSTHKEFVAARKMWITGPNHIDSTKGHKQKLCEKCIRTGKYCGDGGGVEVSNPIKLEDPKPKIAYSQVKMAYTNSLEESSPIVATRNMWVTGPNHPDPTKGHKQDLREKCIRSGKYYGDPSGLANNPIKAEDHKPAYSPAKMIHSTVIERHPIVVVVETVASALSGIYSYFTGK